MQQAPAFPSIPQALLLALALILLQVLAYALLQELHTPLGLPEPALWPLAMVLGNGLLFLGLMPLARLGYRQLFHASKASPWVIGLLTLPQLLMITPLLALLLGQLGEFLMELLPVSAAEQAGFELMMDGSLTSLVAVCLLAPVLEEMLFRGVVLRGMLTRYPRGQAIAASALLFGLMHLNVYQFVIGSLLGLLLGWLYERTRSLIPCIGLHAAYNSWLTLLAARADAQASPWGELGSLGLAAVGIGLLGAWGLRRVLAPRPLRP
ncbi:CPBP family intramembrane glutamic endopeptidase [Inhella proteolytica]|uniref:CPBP family intramembrane metalloprotease n=1 Tax=Inhella proteolytica TaxID=2795029 RepID=A0A931NFN1_9BURK|nr:CPBP family intramembrane glutamic endopeptidase [Inhella proteolytica]MBH9576271.1 CPBP family intramembrane metalloprotease [Inhella proteolytica]